MKSAAEVIKESLLEVNYNLDASFCDAQDFKQSLRQNENTWCPCNVFLYFNELKQSKIYTR